MNTARMKESLTRLPSVSLKKANYQNIKTDLNKTLLT